MNLASHNFYHPFKNSSLGFLLNDGLPPANLNAGEVLDKVNLYYQPLETRSVVISIFIVKLIVICIGEVVGTKLLACLKKEKSITTNVTKLFIISQMILHPILHILELIINTIYPVNEVIGNWFCFLDWLLWGVFMRIGLNNSFICALLRYFFIVHEEKVNHYGKTNVKRWFLYFSLAIPFIQFTLQALGSSPRLSFVNKCYGTDHRKFLTETSSLNIFKSRFIKLEHPYVDINFLLEIGKRICKVIEATLFLFMGFNLTEVFLYYKIFTKIERDHKASMTRLRKILTDSSKEGRHRRKILNVLITFFAWLVESIGFLVIFLGTFVLGHENNFFNFFMQTLTLVIYFNILPYVFMMNDSNLKSNIIESKLYGTILSFFHCNYINQVENDEDSREDENISEEDHKNANEKNSTEFEEDNHGNENSQHCQTRFKNSKKKDFTENERKHEKKNTSQDSSLGSSSTNDIDIVDLE